MAHPCCYTVTLLQAVQRCVLREIEIAPGPIQPPLQWEEGFLPSGVERQEREANHPPLYSAEVKNGDGIPPLPHTSSWYGA
jgi:hypothetical protein